MVKFGGNWTAQHRGVLLVFGLVLLLTAATGAAVHRRLDAAIRQATVRQLEAAVRSTRSSLEFWYQSHVRYAQAIAAETAVRELSLELIAAPRETLALGVHPAQWAFREQVRPGIERNGLLDALVLDAEGVVLASTRDGLAGTYLVGLEEHQGRLASAFAGQAQFLPPLAAEHASPYALSVTVPIRASDERIAAVLLLQVDSRVQFSGLVHAGRLGNALETFVFDEQGRTLTDTVHDAALREAGAIVEVGRSRVLAQLRDPGVALLKGQRSLTTREEWSLTQLAQSALRRQSGSDTSGYRNVLGQQVLGAWAYSQELGLGMGAEISESDALATYQPMRHVFLGALVAVVGLFAALLFEAARHRARLQRLSDDADARLEARVAERTRELASANGRLALEVNERRSSESRLRAVQAMLEETTEKYARLSQIDPLTELANRRRFDEFLEREWRRCIRNRSQMSLLLLDFDYFKLFNDTYGHSAGDECLRAVAEVLSAAARRPGDLAARIGGEEFAVVLCDTGSEGALRVARQIHAWIEDLAIEHDTTQVIGVDNVTVSIGVASMQPELTSNPSALVYHADEALYAAKEDGRNCIRAYEVGLSDVPEHDETFTRTKSLRSHDLVRRSHH